MSMTINLDCQLICIRNTGTSEVSKIQLCVCLSGVLGTLSGPWPFSLCVFLCSLPPGFHQMSSFSLSCPSTMILLP